MAINLRTLTHSKTVYDGPAVAIMLPAVGGAMEVLPRHIPFATLIDIGVVTARREDGSLFECTVSSGIAYLINDDLTIFAGAAETVEMIDLERARTAAADARRWMEEHRADPVLRQAGLELLRRAENRIRFVEKRKVRHGD